METVRRGPNGERTLCNACGLRAYTLSPFHFANLLILGCADYAKLKLKRSMFSRPSLAGVGAPPIDIAFLRKCGQFKGDHQPPHCSASGACHVTDKGKHTVDNFQLFLAVVDDEWDFCDDFNKAELTSERVGAPEVGYFGRAFLPPVTSTPQMLVNFRWYLGRN